LEEKSAENRVRHGICDQITYFQFTK
jgi:hypothetical protein